MDSGLQQWWEWMDADGLGDPAPERVQPERTRMLIVCEGQKTEPIYFEYLRAMIPSGPECITVLGIGDNTLNVVKRAIRERERRSGDPLQLPVDEVWAVFDRDDYPAQRFNEAIFLATRNGVHAAWSNEAFELWYVLHFQYLQTRLHRRDYFSLLSTLLGSKYRKNDPAAVTRLLEKGSVQQAIRWARKLEAGHAGETPADSIPVTTVYRLVERLLGMQRGG